MSLTLTEEQEHAKRALVEFEKRITVLYQPLLRIITRDPKLVVKAHASVSAASNNHQVFLQIPWALGETRKHDFDNCGKIGPDDKHVCSACAVEEQIDRIVFHESFHLTCNSFGSMSGQEYKRQGQTILPELAWENVSDSYEVGATLVKQSSDSKFYGAWNFVEDAYVNRRGFEARWGVVDIFKRELKQVLSEGFDLSDGSHHEWKTFPLDRQACLAFYLMTHEATELAVHLDPEVQVVLNDPEVKEIASDLPTDTDEVIDRIMITCRLVRRLADLGFDILPQPEPPTLGNPGESESESSEPQEGEGEQGESESESEEGEGEGESEQGEQESESEEGEGEGESGEEADEAEGEGEGEGAAGEAGDDEPEAEAEGDGGEGDGAEGGSERNDEAEAEAQEGNGEGEGESEEGESESEAGGSGTDDKNETTVPSGGDSEEVSQQEAGSDEPQGGEGTAPGAEGISEPSGKEWNDHEIEEAMQRLFGHEEEMAPQEDDLSEGHNSDLEEAINYRAFDVPPGTVQKYQECEPGLDPWSQNWHRVRPLEVSRVEVIQPTSKLRTVFADNRKRGITHGLSRGPRLDPRSLYRFADGDNRVFGKRDKPRQTDWFVLVGCDNSGSTSRFWIDQIKELAGRIGVMLNGCGVKFGIYFHSSDDQSYESGRTIHKLVHTAVKRPDQPWNDDALRRIAAVKSGGFNIDGLSFEQYRKVLQQQRATDKLFLYLTDGAMRDADGVLARELKILKQQQVHTVAVEFGVNGAANFGLDVISVSGASDLQLVVNGLADRLS